MRDSRSCVTYASATSNLYDDLRDRLRSVIGARRGLAVCDIGGGAHPFFSAEEIAALGLRYTILDISREELEQSPPSAQRVLCDIAGDLTQTVDIATGTETDLRGRFDLVFSVMLAEHVRDAGAFHRNAAALLAPGGSAIHLFPTLYTLPFLVNLLIPEFLAAVVNRIVAPAERHVRSKFPAYYRWCRGPRSAAIARLERLGVEVVEYRGYYGHGYYQRIPLLHRAHKWKTAVLERHPLPLLTNYALVWYRKG